MVHEIVLVMFKRICGTRAEMLELSSRKKGHLFMSSRSKLRIKIKKSKLKIKFKKVITVRDFLLPDGPMTEVLQ